MKIVKLIPKYLCHNKIVIAAFILCTAIFSAVTYLYRMQIEAVLYAVMLCGLTLFFIACINFYYFYKRHQERARLLAYPMTVQLIKPRTIIEEDYLSVINELRRLNRIDAEQRQNERLEYLDYYNTWIHQIKTPIAVMRLKLQEEDTKKHTELKQQLFNIEQYAEMALGFSRLDNAKDFKFDTYNLDVIIKEAIHKYAPLFISKKLKLNYEPVSVTVLTDKKWLMFVVEQILSNAIKYTEKGSVTITAKGNVLQITDTGIGILPEDLPLIFEKGYTGFNGRLDKKSTGIGLYLCNKALEKLSHKLSVVSEPCKGSTFFLDMSTHAVEVE